MMAKLDWLMAGRSWKGDWRYVEMAHGGQSAMKDGDPMKLLLHAGKLILE